MVIKGDSLGPLTYPLQLPGITQITLDGTFLRYTVFLLGVYLFNLEGDRTIFLSMAFKTGQSDFLLPVEIVGKSTRRLVAKGDIRSRHRLMVSLNAPLS